MDVSQPDVLSMVLRGQPAGRLLSEAGITRPSWPTAADSASIELIDFCPQDSVSSGTRSSRWDPVNDWSADLRVHRHLPAGRVQPLGGGGLPERGAGRALERSLAQRRVGACRDVRLSAV